MSKSVQVSRKTAHYAVLVPLAAVLSMSASHEAMAACSPSAATPNPVIDCVGNGNVNSTGVNQIGGVAASGIILAPADAVPDDDSVADVTNNATITVGFNGANTGNFNVRGINADDFGTYTIANAGNIFVSSTGRGQAYGIAGNGDVTSLIATNSGLIEATRNLGGVNANAAQVTSATINVLNAANNGAGNNQTTTSLAIAAGVFTEEELDSEELTNTASGIIRANGKYAIGVYSRAEEFTLTNEGLITHSSGPGGGMAIGVVSDSGKISEFTFTNTGTVTGDVVMVGGHAQRWWLLSKGQGAGNVSTGNVIGDIQFDNRLNINAQFGQLDTNVENEGTITGNLYYGNGEHELVNEEDATITGNIDVDQRNQRVTGRTCVVGATNCFATATTAGTSFEGNPAPAADDQEPSPNSASTITTGAAVGATTTYTLNMWGAKEFNFENAGTFIGNISVATAPATTIAGFDVPDSKIELAPHVFGGGGADADSATGPGTIATFQGTLKVADGIVNGVGGTTSIARTTTIAPVIAGTVKDGEWYRVTDGLFGTEVPEVEGSALVAWEAEKNSAGALVIGAEVTDASDLAGVSKPAAAAINALIDAGGEDDDLDVLGAGVQSLATAAEVAKAGAQLAPETNFATQQAALSLNQATGQHINTRLASAGATGGNGGFGGPSGLGMKPSELGRSNLGANNRNEEYVSPRSNALWGQAFGAGLNQDQRELVDGYDARLYGLMAGYDNWIASNTRLGVALGYANTMIDGQGFTAQNSTDIDSWLVELYGSVKGAGWYLTGRTGFAWHSIDTNRVLTVPFKDKATGSHDGQQFNASVEFGAPMRMSGAVITPVASLTYSNLDQDGYTERSGAGMALAVGSQSNDSLVSGLGLKALVPIAHDTAIEGRAIWQHEFLDTNQTVTAAFAAGGGTFTASGPDVGRDTAVLGLGMIANSVEGNSNFQLNYDANIRQDFIGHVGSARLTFGF